MSDQDKPPKSQQSQEILTQTVQVLGVVFSAVITVVKWSFLITMFILGTIFWLLDLWLGDGRNPIDPPWNRRRQRTNPKQAKEQIRREIKRKQSKKFLNEYENMLIQLQQEETERIQREQFKEEEKKERLESLSIRERILLKIRENPGALLENILTENEMEELALMILEALL